MATKTVPGRCSHCGAMYEVLPEAIGLVTECPHCHNQTEILLAVADMDEGASRKAVWTIVGMVVLVAALVAAIFAVHLAKRLIEQQRARQHAEIQSGLDV